MVANGAERLGEANALPLAGGVAGAIAVSECFQNVTRTPVAGRRSAGISLWRPDLEWLEDASDGPELTLLPQQLWLIGLGHLGQGNAWALGCLPYGERHGDVEVVLQDFDSVVEGNLATSLLALHGDVDERKTRVVSRRLEALGFRTAIIERPFDDSFRRRPEEPAIALAGFDHHVPRQLLGDRFPWVIDAGIGGREDDYLDIMLYEFPSGLDPAKVFLPTAPRRAPDVDAYALETRRLIDQGSDPGDASCGVRQIAGLSIGASFVGAIAGSLSLAAVLREFAGGLALQWTEVDLRTPQFIHTSPNPLPRAPVNPGYIRTSVAARR